MRDNAPTSTGFLKACSHWSRMEGWRGRHKKKRRSGILPKCSLHGRMTTSMQPKSLNGITSPPCLFVTATTPNIQKDWGWEFTFFLTSDTLAVGKNVGVPEQIFSVIKIKCVEQDSYIFYFWTSVTANATPPPLRLCHNCFVFFCFYSPEMSYSWEVIILYRTNRARSLPRVCSI